MLNTIPPLWSGSRNILGEPLLWRREPGDSHAQARLVFSPRKILRIYRANRTESYRPDEATFSANVLSTTLPVPCFSEADLFPQIASVRTIDRHSDEKRLLHFSEGRYFHDLQVCVDYETEARWNGPIPSAQSERLPTVSRLIRDRAGLRLVVLGDSISTGANASCRSGAAPMQPDYVQLLANQIEHSAGGFTLHNFSKGGKTAAWGLTQVEAVIATQPDLLILAFGMNDASDGIAPESFAYTIRTIISTVLQGAPHTEFLVVSGMSPNPAWHLSRSEIRAAYHTSLLGLAGKGIAVADIRSIWNHVVTLKGFESMTGNGVNHPNDFGHRIYSDCLIATLGLKKQGFC